jgi:hypothetical protein
MWFTLQPVIEPELKIPLEAAPFNVEKLLLKVIVVLFVGLVDCQFPFTDGSLAPCTQICCEATREHPEVVMVTVVAERNQAVGLQVTRPLARAPVEVAPVLDAAERPLCKSSATTW